MNDLRLRKVYNLHILYESKFKIMNYINFTLTLSLCDLQLFVFHIKCYDCIDIKNMMNITRISFKMVIFYGAILIHKKYEFGK